MCDLCALNREPVFGPALISHALNATTNKSGTVTEIQRRKWNKYTFTYSPVSSFTSSELWVRRVSHAQLTEDSDAAISLRRHQLLLQLRQGVHGCCRRDTQVQLLQPCVQHSPGP